MKSIYLTLLLSFLLLKLSAQISITTTDMPASSDTIRYSSALVNSVGDYTTTGANYNWDFSGLSFITQGIREFKPSLSTPYGFFFLPPKYGEKVQDTVPIPAVPGLSITITDIYDFYKNSSSKYAVEGLGVKLIGLPVPNFYSDEDELYFFPLNYQNRDSSTFKFSTLTTTLIPFAYSKHGYRITEVDGWGSITTPYGTANCIRVVSTQYSIDTLSGTIANFPFKFGFPNYQRTYQWLTNTEKIPYLEVSGNLVANNFIPTQVRYRDSVRIDINNPLGLSVQDLHQDLVTSIYPNPSSDYIDIILPQKDGKINISISDIMGKEVISEVWDGLNQTYNKRRIQVSGLSAGSYLVKLTYKGYSQSIKISKQ